MSSATRSDCIIEETCNIFSRFNLRCVNSTRSENGSILVDSENQLKTLVTIIKIFHYLNIRSIKRNHILNTITFLKWNILGMNKIKRLI